MFYSDALGINRKRVNLMTGKEACVYYTPPLSLSSGQKFLAKVTINRKGLNLWYDLVWNKLVSRPLAVFASL